MPVVGVEEQTEEKKACKNAEKSGNETAVTAVCHPCAQSAAEKIKEHAKADSGDAAQYAVIGKDHVDFSDQIEIVTVNQKADKRSQNISAEFSGQGKQEHKEKSAPEYGGDKPSGADEYFVSKRRPLKHEKFGKTVFDCGKDAGQSGMGRYKGPDAKHQKQRQKIKRIQAFNSCQAIRKYGL